MYRTGPAVVLLCLALALASCGGGSGEGTTGAATGPGPSAKAGATAPDGATAHSSGGAVRSTLSHGAGAAPTPVARSRPAAAEHGCQARIGSFVDRMTDLRQSLLAGLSYAEYVVRVKAIRDAYEEVPVDRLGVDCLSGPARDAEDAFNEYLRAANVWGECAGTEGCAAGEIEGRLQHRWKIASKSLDEVTKG